MAGKFIEQVGEFLAAQHAHSMGQHFLPLLERIPQPILFVNGDGDTDRIAGEPAFLAAAPDASVYNFRDTGHGVSIRRPKEFAALLDRFAQRVFEAPQ